MKHVTFKLDESSCSLGEQWVKLLGENNFSALDQLPLPKSLQLDFSLDSENFNYLCARGFDFKYISSRNLASFFLKVLTKDELPMVVALLELLLRQLEQQKSATKFWRNFMFKLLPRLHTISTDKLNWLVGMIGAPYVYIFYLFDLTEENKIRLDQWLSRSIISDTSSVLPLSYFLNKEFKDAIKLICNFECLLVPTSLQIFEACFGSKNHKQLHLIQETIKTSKFPELYDQLQDPSWF